MRRVVLEDIEVKVWRSPIKIPVLVFVPALLLLSLYVIVYLGANSSSATALLGDQLEGLFGSELEVGQIAIEPDLSKLRLYGASLSERGASRPVISVEQVHVDLDLLSLLRRHVYVTKGRVIAPRVRLEIDAEGELNVLRALGLNEEQDEDDSGGEEMPFALTFEQISLERGEFEMRIEEIFEIEIPEVEISGASMRISRDTLLIDVERARTPRGDLRFYNELFGYPEQKGDWVFGVDDFQIDAWRWSNVGYTVERFSGLVEGYGVEASGQMGFPPEGDDGMTWSVKGEVSAPFWSGLIEYFVGETLHYSIPSFKLGGEGTLNWVEGRGELYAERADAAGIELTEIRSQVAMHNRIVEIKEASFDLYGGRGEVPLAYFDIFELLYSGSARVEGVDLAALTEDFFGIEAPYLSGSARAAFDFSGTFPESLEYDPLKNTLYDHTTDRWIDLTLTSPMVVDRASRELLPSARVSVASGARAWVDQDRAVVPEARITLDDRDVFELSDLAVNFNHLTFERYLAPEGALIKGRIATLTPYLEFYDIAGVEAGEASATLRLSGPLLSPDMVGQLDVQAIQAPGGVAISSVQSAFELIEGEVRFDSLVARAPGGEASLSGSAELLRRVPDPEPGSKFSLYASRPDGALDLDARAEDFDLRALRPWLPAELELAGFATLSAEIDGELDRPQVCADFSARDVLVYGERLERVSAHQEVRYSGGASKRCAGSPGDLAASWEGDGLYAVLEGLTVEHERAGTLHAEALYGLEDGRVQLELSGRGVEPGQLKLLEPYQVTGALDLQLAAAGPATSPSLAGSVRARDLGAMGFGLGSLALTVDTIERDSGEGLSERIIALSGGLIPWFNVTVEAPIDEPAAGQERAPIYARVDLDDFDLVEFVMRTGLDAVLGEELIGPLRQLERARATGAVELDISQARFGDVTAIATLEHLAVGPRALGITNREPILMSYQLDPDQQSVTFGNLSLGRQGRFIELAGAVDLLDEFIDLEVFGALDLSLLFALAQLSPELIPEDLVAVSGYVDLDSSFTGALSDLQAEGQVTWHPTSVELRSLSEPLVIREGALAFSPEAITIPERSALRGSVLGGVFALDGDIALKEFTPGGFDLSLWMHNISYAVPEAAHVTLDSDLRMRGEQISELSSWRVAGTVELIDGLYYQDISVLERELTGRVMGAFDRRTEVYEASLFEELPELGEVQLDVALKAPDGFKLKNQIDRFGLDLEFRIDLQLSGAVEALSVTGDVDVIDGSVLFQGEQFVVRTGTVRFSGDAERPFIDVVATADIRNACRGNALQNEFTGSLALNGAVTTNNELQEEIYQISLNVRGTSDNLDISYDSVPFADQRDIISLILTGCTVDLLTASSASQPTLETLLGPLIGRLEREIQQVVRVEEFNITPGVNRTQVSISDDLTRRLSWRFQLDKAFNQANSTAQSGQLEYQLTDRWAAIFEESSYSDLNTANRFQLDLKLKYRVPLD